MFDRDALQLLQDTAVQAAGVSKAPTDKPMLLIPEGLSLVDIEANEEGRYRFRGTYKTNIAAEFKDYVIGRAALDSLSIVQVFIDTEAGAAKAFFNLGTASSPGHGDDTANLALKVDAAYAALVKACGAALSQRALSDFLEDWAPIIQPNDYMTVATAVQLIRSVTIKQASEASSTIADMRAERSELETIEANAKGGLAPPAGFTFLAPPFDGFTDRQWTVRLSLNTGSKDPQFTLRIVGDDAVKKELSQEFETRLRDGLPPQVRHYRGVFTP